MTMPALQHETQGFTEFVPLPFVHMEAPLWRKGLARQCRGSNGNRRTWPTADAGNKLLAFNEIYGD